MSSNDINHKEAKGNGTAGAANGTKPSFSSSPPFVSISAANRSSASSSASRTGVAAVESDAPADTPEREVESAPLPPPRRLTAAQLSSSLLEAEEGQGAAAAAAGSPANGSLHPLGSPSAVPAHLVLMLERDTSTNVSDGRSTSLSHGNDARHRSRKKQKKGNASRSDGARSTTSSALHSVSSHKSFSPQYMELVAQASAGSLSAHVGTEHKSPSRKPDYVQVSSKTVPSARAPDQLYKSPGASKFAPAHLTTHSPVAAEILIVHTRSSTNNSLSPSGTPDRGEQVGGGRRGKKKDAASATAAGAVVEVLPPQTAYEVSPKRAALPRARTPPPAPANYHIITTKHSPPHDSHPKEAARKPAASAAPPLRGSPTPASRPAAAGGASTAHTSHSSNNSSGDSSRRLHYLQMWRDQRQRMEAKKEEVLSGPSTPSAGKGKASWLSARESAAMRPVSASAAPVMVRHRPAAPASTAAPTRVGTTAHPASSVPTRVGGGASSSASLVTRPTAAAEADDRQSAPVGLTLLERRELRLSRTASATAQSPAPAPSLPGAEADSRKHSLTGLTLLERRERRLSGTASGSQSPGAAANLSGVEPPSTAADGTEAAAAVRTALLANPTLLERRERRLSGAASASPQSPATAPNLTGTGAIPPGSLYGADAKTTAVAREGERAVACAATPVLRSAATDLPRTATTAATSPPPPADGPPASGTEPLTRQPVGVTTHTTCTAASAAADRSGAHSPTLATGSTSASPPRSERHTSLATIPVQNLDELERGVSAMLEHYQTDAVDSIGSAARSGHRSSAAAATAWQRASGTPPPAPAAAAGRAPEAEDHVVVEAAEVTNAKMASGRASGARSPVPAAEATASGITSAARYTRAEAPVTRAEAKAEMMTPPTTVGTAPTRSSDRRAAQSGAPNTAEKAKEKEAGATREPARSTAAASAAAAAPTAAAANATATTTTTATTTAAPSRYSYRSQRQSGELSRPNAEDSATREKDTSGGKTTATSAPAPQGPPAAEGPAAGPASTTLTAPSSATTTVPARYSYRSQRVSELLECTGKACGEEADKSATAAAKATPVIAPPATQATPAAAAPARSSYPSQRKSVVLMAAEAEAEQRRETAAPEEPTAAAAPRNAVYAARLRAGLPAVAATAPPTDTGKAATLPAPTATTTTTATVPKALPNDGHPSSFSAPAAATRGIATTQADGARPARAPPAERTSGGTETQTPRRPTDVPTHDASPSKSLGSIPMGELDTLEDSISTMLSYYTKHGKAAAAAHGTPPKGPAPAALAEAEDLLTDSEEEREGEGAMWYWCLDVTPIPIVVPPTVRALDFRALYIADDATLLRQSRLAAQPTPAPQPERERAHILQHVASRGTPTPAPAEGDGDGGAAATLADKQQAVWRRLEEEEEAVQQSLTPTKVAPAPPPSAPARRFTDTSDALDGGRGLEREQRQRERASRVQELLLICEEQRARKKIVLAEMEGSRPWREYRP